MEQPNHTTGDAGEPSNASDASYAGEPIEPSNAIDAGEPIDAGAGITNTEIEEEVIKRLTGIERFVEPAVPVLTEYSSREEISRYCNYLHHTYSENITFARVGLRMMNEIIPGIRNSDLTPTEKTEKISGVKKSYRDEITYFMFQNDYPNSTLLTIPYQIILKHHDTFRDILDFYRTKFWTFNLGHNLTPKAKNKAYRKNMQ